MSMEASGLRRRKATRWSRYHIAIVEMYFRPEAKTGERDLGKDWVLSFQRTVVQ